MQRNASRELARQDAVDTIVRAAPDCECGGEKSAGVTSGTIEVFCEKCGTLLHTAELDEPGAEQRVRY